MTGAFCVMRGRSQAVFDLPILEVAGAKRTVRRIDAAGLADLLQPFAGCWAVAWLEDVSSSPQQGVSSAFSFGRGLGVLEGVLGALEIPVHRVRPATWTKALGLRKGDRRHRAVELFPSIAGSFARKKDCGRADAALIAYYGATRS